MTIAEWRSTRERVKAARSILDNETFVEMRQTLLEAAPIDSQALGWGSVVTDGDRSRYLGKVEGYQECLRNLDKLGEFTPRPKEVPARYEPPEE